MYGHIMVPVDDSVLSSLNAETAVQLAQRLGSRITFFHAAEDLGATRSGARLKAANPQAYKESVFGDTHMVLAQYAACAEVAGVPYDTQCLATGHPADAIVEAAVAHGCDLIVMATRGEHGLAGLLHGSHTEQVLRQSPVPLLVTRVASQSPVGAVEKVTAILHDEHRTILSLVAAMRHMVTQPPAPQAAIDLPHLAAMLRHLATYSARIHRPKMMRLALVTGTDAAESAALLRDLHARHAKEQGLIDEALARLEPVMSEMGAPVAPLFAAVTALADGVQTNVEAEHRWLVAMARHHATDEHWASMAAVFHAHHFPGFGAMPVDETRRLFTRIAELNAGAGTV
jgi:nucleotide-binding universal stress UspA family protein/hemerythrin-like domain-containing protein